MLCRKPGETKEVMKMKKIKTVVLGLSLLIPITTLAQPGGSKVNPRTQNNNQGTKRPSGPKSTSLASGGLAGSSSAPSQKKRNDAIGQQGANKSAAGDKSVPSGLAINYVEAIESSNSSPNGSANGKKSGDSTKNQATSETKQKK